MHSKQHTLNWLFSAKNAEHFKLLNTREHHMKKKWIGIKSKFYVDTEKVFCYNGMHWNKNQKKAKLCQNNWNGSNQKNFKWKCYNLIWTLQIWIKMNLLRAKWEKWCRVGFRWTIVGGGPALGKIFYIKYPLLSLWLCAILIISS